jgi:hypothetical protein
MGNGESWGTWESVMPEVIGMQIKEMLEGYN